MQALPLLPADTSSALARAGLARSLSLEWITGTPGQHGQVPAWLTLGVLTVLIGFAAYSYLRSALERQDAADRARELAIARDEYDGDLTRLEQLTHAQDTDAAA